jgi:hypothetical protein
MLDTEVPSVQYYINGSSCYHLFIYENEYSFAFVVLGKCCTTEPHPKV